MKKKYLFLRFAVLVTAMMCALGAAAAEAYACYTSSNTTLTFYYDNQRASRSGTTYNLNTGTNYPAWYSDGTNANVTKVVFNSSFSNARPTTTRYWFDAMANLQSITGMQYLNTSSVREMFAMFRGCSSLTSVDVSGFNTANVTNMYAMFRNCSSLTSVDLGNFNTANVTDMCAMFYGCSAMTSLNVSNFNTAKVTNMNTMFRDCSSLTSLDLSSFNTASVTNMGWMFMSCYNLASLDMSSFNTANVTNMSGMFYSCNKLTSLDLSNFNTAKVTNMNQMFYACSGLTSLDVSSFNTASVTSMGTMFYGCRNLTTIYAGSGWSTNAVTSSTDMFKNCTNLVGGKGTTYDANHVDKTYAHIDGGTSNPGYFTEKGPEAYACYTSSNTTLTFYYDNQRASRSGTTYDLNTDVNFTDWHNDGTNYYVNQVVFDPSFANARPTSTSDWFDGMTNLESITGMNYLNTSEVTSMAWMFLGCRKLTSLDVSHFNTSKVIYMTQMFYRCIGLTSLDLSGFNTSKVIDMQSMFEESNKLQTIYVGNDWNTDAVAYSDYMFKNCTNLVGGKGTTYDANHVDKTYAHIDGGTSNPGYFTAKNAGLRGDVNGDNNVNISDVTTLIDYLLSGNASGISLSGADCNQDGSINISDVTALIDYLLSNHW